MEFNVNQIRLCYDIFGPSDAPIKIIFLPDFEISAQAYCYQRKFLENDSRFECCVLHNIGCTDKCSSFHSFAALAHAVLQLALRLNWVEVDSDHDASSSKKIHLVGFAVGGLVALKTAIAFPHFVASLTLVNCHTGGWLSASPVQLWLPHLAAWPCAVNASYLASALQLGRYGIEHVNRLDETLQMVESSQVHSKRPTTSWGMWSHFWAKATQRITAPQLHRLRKSGVPVMVCVGEQDMLVSPSHSYWLHRVLECRMEKFEAAGHAVMMESHERINGALVDHITSSQSPTYSQRIQHLHRLSRQLERYQTHRRVMSVLHHTVMLSMVLVGLGATRIFWRLYLTRLLHGQPLHVTLGKAVLIAGSWPLQLACSPRFRAWFIRSFVDTGLLRDSLCSVRVHVDSLDGQ